MLTMLYLFKYLNVFWQGIHVHQSDVFQEMAAVRGCQLVVHPGQVREVGACGERLRVVPRQVVVLEG